jgi:hypothetical protein
MTDPKPSISSAALSAPTDEHDALSPAVLNALLCVEGYDDKKVNAAPKLRAPSVERRSPVRVSLAKGSFAWILQ